MIKKRAIKAVVILGLHSRILIAGCYRDDFFEMLLEASSILTETMPSGSKKLAKTKAISDRGSSSGII